MESAEDGVGVTTGELKICVNIERKGRRKKCTSHPNCPSSWPPFKNLESSHELSKCLSPSQHVGVRLVPSAAFLQSSSGEAGAGLMVGGRPGNGSGPADVTDVELEAPGMLPKACERAENAALNLGENSNPKESQKPGR